MLQNFFYYSWTALELPTTLNFTISNSMFLFFLHSILQPEAHLSIHQLINQTIRPPIHSPLFYLTIHPSTLSSVHPFTHQFIDSLTCNTTLSWHSFMLMTTYSALCNFDRQPATCLPCNKEIRSTETIRSGSGLSAWLWTLLRHSTTSM
jgi:hypothetical protein